MGNAVSRGNPEVEEVLSKRLRYCSLPEIVRDEFLWGAQPIVVAGTHGKTTTSFMTAWALVQSGIDPGFLIGGISRGLRDERGAWVVASRFVIEGDEYDSAFFDKTAKFLKYIPQIVVVNGIEFDHADIYRDLDQLRLAFKRLVRLVPGNGRLLLCADDPEAVRLSDDAPCAVESFGLVADADWCAENIRYEARATIFDVRHRGDEIGTVTLPLLGRFNVRNALGATAASVSAGASCASVLDALSTFRGVRRRLEVRGVARGITVYDDFAHHPTAVRETLQALRATPSDGRVWAVFEPRSATACRKVFQKEFVDALQHADEVLVSDVYRSALPAAERPLGGGSGRGAHRAGCVGAARSRGRRDCVNRHPRGGYQRPGRAHVERRIWRHPRTNVVGALGVSASDRWLDGRCGVWVTRPLLSSSSRRSTRVSVGVRLVSVTVFVASFTRVSVTWWRAIAALPSRSTRFGPTSVG